MTKKTTTCNGGEDVVDDCLERDAPRLPPPKKKKPKLEENLKKNDEVSAAIVAAAKRLFSPAVSAPASAASVISSKADQEKNISITNRRKTNNLSRMEMVPSSIVQNGKPRNNLEKMRQLFVDHAFRTSIVASPRPALSIYKDSCCLNGNDEKTTNAPAPATTSSTTAAGKEFLIIMLGLHPHQKDLEKLYASSIKNSYVFLLFCRRLQDACPAVLEANMNDDNGTGNYRNELLQLLQHSEQQMYESLSTMANSIDGTNQKASISTANSTTEAETNARIAQIIHLMVRSDPGLRIEQLQHEYERIVFRNSTLSNVAVQRFLNATDSCIKDVFFKSSHVEKYERITVFLYDKDLDERKPPPFAFLPALTTALQTKSGGPEAIAKNMVKSFWMHLLRRGYLATDEMKNSISLELEKYFMFGITKDPSVPLSLNAHFTPSYPMSFYIYGKAGTGKSSFARNFSPALNLTIEEHADPEIQVRFIKQNLNKPFDVLQLELDLRPNNNDLSVMSIIQSRKCPMRQTKPGLVVLDMEEMPSCRADANPNQLETAQLISQRFSGRKGDYRVETAAPRNSCKRGISGDASIVPIFTSNYEMAIESIEALQKLEMFQNLLLHRMTAVEGEDRSELALAYIQQCIRARFHDLDLAVKVHLDIPLGKGDIRPLVRHLRMLAFYTSALIAKSLSVKGTAEASIVQRGAICRVSCTESRLIELKVGSMDNLFPITPQFFDQRTAAAMTKLQNVFGESLWDGVSSELSVILDFWFSKTLAPAVVVSNDSEKIKAIVDVCGALEGVQCISGVDVGQYKMMKSLYDPSDTPNLRDDIRKFGRGALVAVELSCSTLDTQLCIREIVEDTPSMTAFSTDKSALHKAGLLFGVYVKGGISPELQSRASWIL